MSSTTVRPQPGAESASSQDAAEHLVDELVRRAQAESSLLETIKLDHALRKLPPEARRELSPARVAVLSSATAEHLTPGIRVGGLRRRLGIETYACGFGQYRHELLDPNAPLTAFQPQFVVFVLTLADLAAPIPFSATWAQVDQALGQTIGDLKTLWHTARERFGATVIQQSILDVSEPVFGSYDALVPASPSRVAARANDLLARAAAEDGVLWLDITREAARDGLDAWFDTRQWLQARMPIAPAAVPRFGDLVARIIAAERGLSKKCLVLDLDNTLWGGVVGDDGIDGIVLGEGTASGEAHLALQRYARGLKDRGVILAICSKNDAAIVDAVFRDHPEMVLRREDISAAAVNWNDKVTNLTAIADELNIGLDSLVFVDDNPFERAHVREALPMVAVPELPDDPAGFVRCLARAGYFEAVSFTAEDRRRSADYAANAARNQLQRTSASLDDFLRGLDMTVTFGPVRAVDMERAAQLINKTNQFNTTGRRYSIDELRAFCAVPEHCALQFRLADRFGDSGLVSVLLMRRMAGDPQAFAIDCWVMSCRVFGRRLEHEAMNAAVEAARERGVTTIWADLVRTPRNGVIDRLYDELGFSPVESPDSSVRRWRLAIDRYQPHSTPIRRTDSRS